MNDDQFIPKYFQMQWHLTERCNLRCEHCYQENFDTVDLSFHALESILEQYTAALCHFSEKSGRQISGRITLTGGEPFLREDFLDLVEKISKQRRRFRFAILTNGTLIGDPTAKRLARWKPDYVQVSIDGMRETHDALRSPGSFDQAVRGIRFLKRHGIRTIISFTASRRNFTQFEDVARLGYALGVERVWADRLIPVTSEMHEQSLSPGETKRFFEAMLSARKTIQRDCETWSNRLVQLFFRKKPTEIAMHRALQFLVGGGTIYHCAAGRSLVAVLADGTLLPCRRLPIPAGNLLKTPLLGLYKEADIMRQLRQPCRPDSCRGCVFVGSCGGGLRCLSYAVSGDSFVRDPGCWLPLSDPDHFQDPK